MSLLSLPRNGKVAVLGAGISGLTFTYFLSKLRPDLQFSVFDKANRVGGWMSSPHLHVRNTNESILLEKGPRTLRGVKDGSLLMIDILRKLNLENQIEVLDKNSNANKKYITDAQGEIVQVPNSISSTINFLKRVEVLDSKLISGLFKEPFVKPVLNDDETVEQFFKRRLGSTVLTDNVISAIMHGIYAGDVGKLSVKSVLPDLKDMELESGSIAKHLFKKLLSSSSSSSSKRDNPTQLSECLQTYEQLLSPEANLLSLQTKLKSSYPMIKLHDGMETLPKHLAKYLLTQTKTKIKFNTSIEQCDPITGEINGDKFDHIRSTINAHALAKALPSGNPLVSNLNSIQYVSIFLTNVYTRKSVLIPKNKPGFGFLRPRHKRVADNPQALLGTIYDSDIENSVEGLFNGYKAIPNENNKLTLMMGGHYYTNWSIPSNKLNIKIVKDVLQEKLKVDLSQYNIKVIPDDQKLQVDSINDDDMVMSYCLHKDCIPQYNIGYQENKTKALDILEKQHYKLSFGGTVFADGVGVPDCVSNSFNAALMLR
ncbi:HEM14 [Candida oxycetoniae]|uniref:Protoporphyrinogen oxidase n=1 Tax=Candida oxycetoniae TaxID=497107 RepID=A0AAI9SUE5_9ASCO|nr:HEM14 [Candida oxycetoniae]KAI3402699.2 HEM14 [Candida oxycetoniae]